MCNKVDTMNFIIDYFKKDFTSRLHLVPITLQLEPRTWDREFLPDWINEWQITEISNMEMTVGTGIYIKKEQLNSDELPPQSMSNSLSWELLITEEQRSVDMLRSCKNMILKSIIATRNALLAKQPELEAFFPSQMLNISGGEYMWLYYLDDHDKWNDISCETYECVYIEGIGHQMLLQGIPHIVKNPLYDDWDFTAQLLMWNDAKQEHVIVADFAIRANEQVIQNQLKENLWGEIAEPNYANIRPEALKDIKTIYDYGKLEKSPFIGMRSSGSLKCTMGGQIYDRALLELLMQKVF